MNLLVAPSLWQETFGFIVLVALSEGIPVVSTTTVGAAELITPEYGCVVQPSADALEETLKALLADTRRIDAMSRAIGYGFVPKVMVDYAREIESLYEAAIR